MFHNKTVKELRNLLAQHLEDHSIKQYSKMRKDVLVDAMTKIFVLHNDELFLIQHTPPDFVYPTYDPAAPKKTRKASGKKAVAKKTQKARSPQQPKKKKKTQKAMSPQQPPVKNRLGKNRLGRTQKANLSPRELAKLQQQNNQSRANGRARYRIDDDDESPHQPQQQPVKNVLGKNRLGRTQKANLSPRELAKLQQQNNQSRANGRARYRIDDDESPDAAPPLRKKKRVATTFLGPINGAPTVDMAPVGNIPQPLPTKARRNFTKDQAKIPADPNKFPSPVGLKNMELLVEDMLDRAKQKDGLDEAPDLAFDLADGPDYSPEQRPKKTKKTKKKR